jgi:hypothetical protein
MAFIKEKNESALTSAFNRYEGDDTEDVYNLKTLAGIYKDIADEQDYSEDDERYNYQKVLSMLQQIDEMSFNPQNTQANKNSDEDQNTDLNLLEKLYNSIREDTAEGDNPRLDSYIEEDGDEVALYIIPVWRQVPNFPKD